jgi:hypothetical protein
MKLPSFMSAIFRSSDFSQLSLKFFCRRFLAAPIQSFADDSTEATSMKKTVILSFASLLFVSSGLLAEEPMSPGQMQAPRRLALLVSSGGAPTKSPERDCGSDTEDAASSNLQYSELLSGWLKSQPKFTTLFAVHFASDESAPVVPCATTRVTEEIQKVGDSLNIPRVTKPMKFSTGFPAGLGKIVDEVISCGHRICNGKQCVDVTDETVKGSDCTNETVVEDEQPILMVPVAPPAPPAVFVAESEEQSRDPLADMLLHDKSLNQAEVSVPVGKFVRLMMDRAEMATRLEMSEQIASERTAAMEQILALSDKNARLATQLAIAEVRQQYTDNLAASMADRAETALKLTASAAATPNASGEAESQSPAMKAIQEDLANIRKQMSLLRRTQPVPFASSSVGLPARPYIPTAQIVTPPTLSPSLEGEESESTIK